MFHQTLGFCYMCTKLLPFGAVAHLNSRTFKDNGLASISYGIPNVSEYYVFCTCSKIPTFPLIVRKHSPHADATLLHHRLK
jgi:hypothetical protein